MNERCKQTSKRTRESPYTYLWILGWSDPQCVGPVLVQCRFCRNIVPISRFSIPKLAPEQGRCRAFAKPCQPSANLAASAPVKRKFGVSRAQFDAYSYIAKFSASLVVRWIQKFSHTEINQGLIQAKVLFFLTNLRQQRQQHSQQHHHHQQQQQHQQQHQHKTTPSVINKCHG